MKQIFNTLLKNPVYKNVAEHVSANSECSVNGLWGSSWALFISTIAYEFEKSNKELQTFIFITGSDIDAEECCEEIELFLPGSATLLPPLEVVDDIDFSDDYSRNVSLIERMKVLNQLVNDSAKTGNNEPELKDKGREHCRINFIVTSIHALMQEMPLLDEIKSNTFVIDKGKEYKQEELIKWLEDRDFERASQVELAGEFSLRGCIIDVFPFSTSTPYRIEFFGDEVDSIRFFDVDSQMSLKEVDKCQIMALKNDKKNSGSGNTLQPTVVPYLPANTIVVFKNRDDIEEKANSIIPEPGKGQITGTFDDVQKSLEQLKKIYLSTLETDIAGKSKAASSKKGSFSFEVKSLERFSQGLAPAMKELKEICSAGKKIIVFCNNEAEEHRFRELLEESSFNPKSLELRIGGLKHGFQIVKLKLALISYNELFKRYEQRKKPKAPVKAKPIDSFLDLKKGDLVVHIMHGIARFKGIKELESNTKDKATLDRELDAKFETSDFPIIDTGNNRREYLFLEFDEGTVVYVPATSIDLVQKYIGPSEHKPKLSKLGSKSWDNKKAQARSAVSDLANELISLQAVRASMAGIAYHGDDEFQKEFEAAFIYQETEDQLNAANDIKIDMENPAPMDRLICGDVGYGKTELAMRAAFRTVMNGKQVAVLVPTTILAQQHYKTFSERMADYPVKVEVISRFRTKKEQKEILQLAAEGNVDIVIGTHRLVQKDVFFKEIGLVVIDEEQKFGVKHKEKFKTLRHMVDVLTLTATPIPRTLHMSMLGLRDISSLNTPPMDRKAIQTRIIRFKPELIRQIIIHELNRNGQVFFVHNRVYNIEQMAATIRELVPEARIVIGHGQMNEKLLESRMRAFVDGEADILISTTIIESGLDIPNVNTIIINDAYMFGLADLHQLRGRVGRYKHRAYAYLVLPTGRTITPEAEKKVKAIEEFSGLGAGFKIALRDLEIRGAGNFLGSQQHGHIAAVGYEMYCRLLEIVVKRLKNQPVPLQISVTMNLNLNSYLPNDYISDYKLKMEIYRKLSRLQKTNEVDEIALLFKDRFGTPPQAVQNLIWETEVRIAAFHAGIRNISNAKGTIIINHVNHKKAEQALNSISRYVRFINTDTLHIKLPDPAISPEEVILFLKQALTPKSK